MPFAFATTFLAALAPLSAQTRAASAASATTSAPTGNDLVFWHSDDKSQRGRVVSYDSRGIKLEVLLVAGQPPAQVTIPYSEIARIEFAPNANEIALLAAPEKNERAILDGWAQRRPLLAMPASNAGEFGIAAANLLLSGTAPAEQEQALAIFQAVESSDWNDDRRSLARRGRLRAMIALGKGTEAVAEARKVAEEAEDPEVTIEANLVVGEAAFAQLKKLQEDHPRWEDDVNVRPERQRLLLEALDHLLHPSLFHGSDGEASPKGLWRALEVCEFDGRRTHAIELATDIAVLYPGTPEAQKAADFLKTNQPDSKNNDDAP